MIFFRKKNRRADEELAMESEIQKTRQEYLEKANTATEQTQKLIDLLDDKDIGITGMIFYATGGADRDDRLRVGKRS
jgi:hypothetical protein